MGNLKNGFASYFAKNKVAVIFLIVCILVIFLSSFIASAIQSNGWSIEVTDLRDAENEGTAISLTGEETEINGKVVSGILFKPKDATADNPLPAVVLTHGYLNNREMQLQNAIELARRGFVVLTVDREGHGNYENSGETSAVMATSGLYDSVKYLYNMDYVDKDKIGISGHSMGGMTTALTLSQDRQLGLVSAGLIQAWSSFMGAGADVDVGMLKAQDDEFFFTTNEGEDGTISREYLSTRAAKTFIGNTELEGDVVSGAIYVNGQAVETTGGQETEGAFRVVYEISGVHPQNHCSVEGANAVVNFFYNAFGTPNGYEYISEGNQVWWVKEAFSLIGMIGFFALIFPLVSLLLTTPVFRSLRVAKQQVVEETVVVTDETGAEQTMVCQKLVWDGANIPLQPKPLKGVQKNISYWLAAIGIMLFSGFSIHSICTEYGSKWFPNTQLYPQDTTNWVAMWAVCSALFSLAVILFFWLANTVVNKIRYGDNYLEYQENPFAAGKIATGLGGLLKTFVLALLVLGILMAVLYTNWAIWTVDFRIWTLAVKVFDMGVLLPTIVRYGVFFGIFFIVSALFNETYRASNIPEWASTLINVFFNFFGVLLVIAIQYGEFTSTGVMWQPDMNLGYIVLFPMVPILAIATVISRRMTAKTGNMWLGAFINTLLFTLITCSNTASSFAYIMG
ncbi:MAG TPA: alpha/beta fold hydrolase [Candidatus Caccalectryoclostridium excrementigallinarum]|uniref:Alpha/beta fold hydrolase n=1 Tax=Candidatus Caccalectryoclostridium excrementigallinarum TaxID=2840710 RepID=A0A9D1MM91_9FIRM|nr:alpha/beta fold hydrolase [Candidatus Caccalectryoclostridium excrementigallinarum]